VVAGLAIRAEQGCRIGVVIVGVDAGFGEDGADDGGSVGAVLVEGLAGPATRDEHAAATEADLMPEARAIRVTDALRDNGPFIRVHDGTSLL
jgi:hypothetical protein